MVACLSHSASSFVYHTTGVTQHIVQVRLQQLRFVKVYNNKKQSAMMAQELYVSK